MDVIPLKMKRKTFTFSIATLIALLAICSVVFALLAADWERPSVQQKCKTILQKQLSGRDVTGEWLFEHHNPSFDTFKFESKHKLRSLQSQIETLSIPGYKLTNDWSSGNCGYTRARWYIEQSSGATLYIGITWVPIDKCNRVAFVWHRAPASINAG